MIQVKSLGPTSISVYVPVEKPLFLPLFAKKSNLNGTYNYHCEFNVISLKESSKDLENKLNLLTHCYANIRSVAAIKFGAVRRFVDESLR
jgi:hypothetical protein